MNEPGANVHRLGNLVASSSPMFLNEGEFDLFRIDSLDGKESLSWIGTFTHAEKDQLIILLGSL